MKNKDYWNKKIIEWEDSIKGENVSFIEKLASYFRKPLKYRYNMCLNILKSFVKNKTVLELGCGSGFFAFELYYKDKPKHIIGIDISDKAIERAKEIAKEKGLTDKLTFLEKDVSSISLPKTDITIGLGFLDYLSSEEIKKLFEDIKSNYFLFTFSEKKFSLLRYIHIIYLKSQRCSKHFYYTKKEIIDSIANKYDNIKFINNKRLSFGCIVHNLPVPKYVK